MTGYQQHSQAVQKILCLNYKPDTTHYWSLTFSNEIVLYTLFFLYFVTTRDSENVETLLYDHIDISKISRTLLRITFQNNIWDQTIRDD